MIIVIKPNTSDERITTLVKDMERKGLKVDISKGVERTILGLIGDTRSLDEYSIMSNEIVLKVMRVQEPYKKANRLFKADDTVIKAGSGTFGGKALAVISGPCSVESEEQIVEIARRVKKAGAQFLRGGAYKPRTSPYSFQGMREDGLKCLMSAKKETGLSLVSEITATELIDLFVEYVDVIQVGARNMQNFELLKQLGKTGKPVLLKRGFASTIEEWLMSAEYIMSEGNEEVILCERGIRTFEKYTRNTLDMCAVPIIKRLSHLPVIVDPSHGTGISWLVEPASKAAVSAGADGLMIEVHNRPEAAMSDGSQSLTPDQFDELMNKIRPLAKFEGREV